MDDFSWGNTRVVVGDNGKKQVFIQGGEYDCCLGHSLLCVFDF
jgi:hypothetical protein